MKIEILIYALVVAMTAVYPLLLSETLGNRFVIAAEKARSTSAQAEKVANDIENGRTQVYLESLPQTFRSLAKADRSLAEGYESFHRAYINIATAMLFTAVIQASLLAFVYVRRRNTTKCSTRSS